MSSLKFKSYAKINLTLALKNKRNDGYHNINSVMQTITLHDDIKLKKDKKISCKINVKNIPTNENNLAIKAAKIFFECLNIPFGVRIYIKKKIPIESGLAGGSSNAAAVLVGLNKLYKTNLTKKNLLELAIKIGADVPFLISGGTALVKGKGEIIYNLNPFNKCQILIIKPKFSVSTKEAYLKFDNFFNNKNFNYDLTENLTFAIKEKQALEKTTKLFFNDFENVLEKDFVCKLKYKMLKNNALCCNLTGSGSAFFAIFKDKKSAKLAKKILKSEKMLTFLCTTKEKYF